MTTEGIARLPRWAQEEVKGLQRQVQQLQAQLDQFQGTADSRVSRWAGPSDTVPLPDADDFRFALPNGHVITVGYRRREADVLEVYGMQPLTLRMRAANIIEISVEA
jgi:hypothetical protein